MRVLTDRAGPAGGSSTPVSLAELYAEETTPWLRANMVSTVDGAGTGADGLTGSINNEADHRVFRALRELADAVLVGAGTAEAEGYRPGSRPLVLVTGRARLPARLREPEPGQVLMVTCASAPGHDDACRMLGDDRVLVCGDDEVDLGRALTELHDRGLSRILCEGGPRLLGDLLAAGLVDELCTTVVPEAVGGGQRRIVTAPDLRVPLDLRLLAEDEGTVFARWTVRRAES
jgi:riboflavin biosynthesis pyrimidine reductase